MSITRVLEVSAVAFPAYEQTSIQVASQDDALDSARASLESAKKRLAEDRAAQEAAEAAEKAAQAEAERRTAALERLNNLITEVSAHE
jgi:phage head maturation protease